MPYIVVKPCLYVAPDGSTQTFLPGRDGWENVLHDDGHPAIVQCPQCFRRKDELGRRSDSGDLQELLEELAGRDNLPDEPAGRELWRLPLDSQLTRSSLAASGISAIIPSHVFDEIEHALEPVRTDGLEIVTLHGGTVSRSGFEVREVAVPKQRRGRHEVKFNRDDVQAIVDRWRGDGLELVGLLHSQPGALDLSTADLDLFATMRRAFGLRYLCAMTAALCRDGSWDYAAWTITAAIGDRDCARPTKIRCLALM